MYLETNGTVRTWQGPEYKLYAEVTERNRDTNELESLKIMQSAIERYLKRKLSTAGHRAVEGVSQLKKKTIAELHRLHP